MSTIVKSPRPNLVRRALPMLALVLLTTLAACGKNGEPVLPGNTTGRPDQDTDNFKRHYPTSTDPQKGVFN